MDLRLPCVCMGERARARAHTHTHTHTLHTCAWLSLSPPLSGFCHGERERTSWLSSVGAIYPNLVNGNFSKRFIILFIYACAFTSLCAPFVCRSPQRLEGVQSLELEFQVAVCEPPDVETEPRFSARAVSILFFFNFFFYF